MVGPLCPRRAGYCHSWGVNDTVAPLATENLRPAGDFIAGPSPAVEVPTVETAPGIRAFEVVLTWVDERILAGELGVGDHLPAERELARMLDVSRAAVREAIRTLQAQGVVRSSVGAGPAGGTTITAVPSHALSRLLRQHVALANFPLHDVIEVRVALERLSARLAATHASADDLAAMRDLLDTMDDPGIDRAHFNDCDTAFHVTVAAAAGNVLARDFTAAIRESMRLPILDRFRTLDSWGTVAPALRRDHEAIYAAVARGDGTAAAALAEEHIRSAWHLLNPV
ncbi:MAG: FadR family transcriptional regulator [Dermatophilaceae bacterium]|nr:FadR family transcriptional regulator [Dermatophilaceae bacterium]